MSAYTNPTIIQDLYGAKAWADASSQVSAALVSGFNQVVDARNKQADIVQKKKEIYQKSYISAEQKALEKSEANFATSTTVTTEQKSKAVQVAYTMGGMTLALSHASHDNNGYVVGANVDQMLFAVTMAF